MKILKITICILLAIASGLRITGGPSEPFYVLFPLGIAIAILIGFNRWPRLHVHLIWLLVTLVATQMMYQQYAYEKACADDYRWMIQHEADIKKLGEHH